MTSLIRLNFPLYCCSTLNDTLIAVAGGGGAAKTGVPNIINIIELCKEKKEVVAYSRKELDVGSEAVMNMQVLQNKDSQDNNCKQGIIAFGLAGDCHLYSILKSSKPEDINQSDADGLRKRLNKNKNISTGTANKDSRNNNNIKSSLKNETFVFKKLLQIKTDFGEDPFQKTVRISPNGLFFVTGGCDGYIRAWETNCGKKIFATQGHKDELTDIDISPDSEKIVTVSRDGSACEWDSKKGLKLLDLHSIWNSQMITRKYRFKFCRYGKVPDKSTYVLFTAHVPTTMDRRQKKTCRLTKWSRRRKDGVENTNDPWRLSIMQPTGKETISAFEISSDGIFLGVGFMEGTVSIYISFSLQCARRITNVHSIFVTGLTFVNYSPTASNNIGDCDAGLISVSADNTVKLTKLSSRTSYSAFVAIFLCFITLVAAALVFSHLGFI